MEEIATGDCLDVLKRYPDEFFDLIMTSPPYVVQRKKTRGALHPDKYVEWFMPRSQEFRRVLKPRGTFILNIKELVCEGERHTYVIDLIKEMRLNGWLWTEDFIWHKKNSHPGKWPNRFRDAWEHCLQFNKQRNFSMYQEAVMEPIGDWANHRLNHLGESDKVRSKSKVGSGFGRNVSNWTSRKRVYPDNVLYLATECLNVNHNAAFPVALPDFFIRLFTKEGGLVLDPFSGSGTVGVAAKRLRRSFVLIDVKPKFRKIAKNRIMGEGSRRTSRKKSSK